MKEDERKDEEEGKTKKKKKKKKEKEKEKEEKWKQRNMKQEDRFCLNLQKTFWTHLKMTDR